MAVLAVPVHPICICDCGQCEAVYGDQRQRYRRRRCQATTWERLMLSSSVHGLGRGNRRGS